MTTSLVVGGTSGIGRCLARRLADRGEDVVLTGRDADRARLIASDISETATGLALDLTALDSIADALETLPPIDHVVIVAAEDYVITATNFDMKLARRAIDLKLIAYAEVVHSVVRRLTARSSVVLFGGAAMIRPYHGSIAATTANAGIDGLVRSLASELAPIRVNGVHPAAVGDTARWEGEDVQALIARTPIGRLVTMDEVASAVMFLLDDGGVNGVNLIVDGGSLVW